LELRELVLICQSPSCHHAIWGFSQILAASADPGMRKVVVTRTNGGSSPGSEVLVPPKILSFYPSTGDVTPLRTIIVRFELARNLEFLTSRPSRSAEAIHFFCSLYISHISMRRCAMWTLAPNALAEKGSELRGGAGSFKPR
jgi:hypothetical protein